MTPQDPCGAKLGGEFHFLHEGTTWGTEAQSEDTILSWLQRTSTWVRLMLHSPGAVVHAVHVDCAHVRNGETDASALFIKCRKSSLHVVLLVVVFSACTLTPRM